MLCGTVCWWGDPLDFILVWAFNAASVANKSPVQIEKGLILQVITKKKAQKKPLGMENGRMKPEITFKLVDRSFNTKTNRQQVDSRPHQVWVWRSICHKPYHP